MANLLTAIRLLLIVPVAWAMADAELISAPLLCLLLALAIATDYFDGIVARATNTASAKGQLFDHGTDFLFVTSGLAGAAVSGLLPLFLPLLIVIAFSQYVFDSYYLFHQKHLKMSFLGRWNGVFYFVPLVVIASARLEFLQALAPLLLELVWWLGILLLISTIASIIDRALAPLRDKSRHDAGN